MDLFGLNRFMDGPDGDKPPKKGAARWFQAAWDNLGGLLGSNLLTFLGCLPLALGVSLGTVYENLWLTLLGGAAGGAFAGAVWAPMLALAMQALQGGTRGWFRRWKAAVRLAPLPAAGTGAVLGLLGGGLLLVARFSGQLLAGENGVPFFVWAILAVDLFLLSAAFSLIFPAMCVRERGKKIEGKACLSLLAAAPGRTCAAAAGALCWFGLGTALFPVSVPFALVLGFWPPALLTAQLMLPPLARCFHVPSWQRDGPEQAESGHKLKQAGEIWWRQRWPAVLILTAAGGLLLWGGSQLFTAREPDLQIAVVHAEPLPDSVRGALEDSLSVLVGDRNGDGRAQVQVNDYTVVFDGSAADADVQTAGATLLVTDVAAGVSALYLTEDPEGFLGRYAGKVDAERLTLWEDCPVLAGLDAGTYDSLADTPGQVSGQSLLGPLAVLPSVGAGDDILGLLMN